MTSFQQNAEKIVDELIEKHCLDLDISIEIADLKRCAGQYHHSDQKIRISRYLFENHPEKLLETVKHELGHAVVDRRYRRKVKPHGPEWKAAMNELGVKNPSRCHQIQLTDYKYIVECVNSDCSFRFGRYRKSKTVKNIEKYRCGRCGSKMNSFSTGS